MEGQGRPDILPDVKTLIKKVMNHAALAWYRVKTSSVAEPTLERPVSQLVTVAQMHSETYEAWCREMKLDPRMHRKNWEFAYILQAVRNAGMLRPGSRGLGFGVGLEPLPAVFARHGCEVVVTDLAPERARGLGWAAMADLDVAEMNQAGICAEEDFARRVTWQPVDMNAIPASLRRAQFDFVWSSCSLEHLGSIAQGEAFVLNSLECLKPSGVAVHTTEFNLTSDIFTIDAAPTVLFRKHDVRGLLVACRARGWNSTFNPSAGRDPLDRGFDLPPYDGSVHLKLMIGRYVSTSVGFVLSRSG